MNGIIYYQMAARLQEWTSKGNALPKCINIGCVRPVAIRHWSTADGNTIPSLKTECTRCATSRVKGKTLEGISIVKKNYCENKDGLLGFMCPMDQTRYSEFPSDCYQMDHRDGNHENNVVENIVTICSLCHARKGKEAGDFNGSKKSSRKLRKPEPPSSDLSSEKMIEETALTSSSAMQEDHVQPNSELLNQ